MKSYSADISGSQVRGTDKYSAAKKVLMSSSKVLILYLSFYCVSKSLLKSVTYRTIKRYDSICHSSTSFLSKYLYHFLVPFGTPPFHLCQARQLG